MRKGDARVPFGCRKGPRIKIFVGNFDAPGTDAHVTSYPPPPLTSGFGVAGIFRIFNDAAPLLFRIF